MAVCSDELQLLRRFLVNAIRDFESLVAVIKSTAQWGGWRLQERPSPLNKSYDIPAGATAGQANH
jgi:hypothetical protein